MIPIVATEAEERINVILSEDLQFRKKVILRAIVVDGANLRNIAP